MAKQVEKNIFWKSHVTDLYRQIRQIQAEKLLPLKSLLETRNFEGVEGSLIDAHQIDHPERDSDLYVEKRLNTVMLCNQLGVNSVLEVGFNWGYSASLYLEASPCRMHSIDIARHWYTPPAGEVIQAAYPGRFTYTWAPSTDGLKEAIAKGESYEFVSIDGAHDYATASSDILLGMELVQEGGVLSVDDSDAPSVAAAIIATIEHDPDYVELTFDNFGLLPYVATETANVCFAQRYFMRRRSRLRA